MFVDLIKYRLSSIRIKLELAFFFFKSLVQRYFAKGNIYTHNDAEVLRVAKTRTRS